MKSSVDYGERKNPHPLSFYFTCSSVTLFCLLGSMCIWAPEWFGVGWTEHWCERQATVVPVPDLDLTVWPLVSYSPCTGLTSKTRDHRQALRILERSVCIVKHLNILALGRLKHPEWQLLFSSLMEMVLEILRMSWKGKGALLVYFILYSPKLQGRYFHFHFIYEKNKQSLSNMPKDITSCSKVMFLLGSLEISRPEVRGLAGCILLTECNWTSYLWRWKTPRSGKDRSFFPKQDKSKTLTTFHRD